MMTVLHCFLKCKFVFSVCSFLQPLFTPLVGSKISEASPGSGGGGDQQQGVLENENETQRDRF